MRYLSGAIRPQLADVAGLGFILTPNMGNRLPAGRPWGADNGCFTRPDRYTDAGYLAWLGARTEQERGTCLFATAPDVVGDAAATLERSLPMLPRIREAGYRPALVAQDGLTVANCPWQVLEDLEGAVFIGGSTDWKMGPEAAALVVEAKRRGLYVHAGRVNSARRFEHFARLGADSADGTFLAFGPDRNLPHVLRWLAGQPERVAELARSFAGAGRLTAAA